MTGQTSASDRYEAARKIIAAHDAAVDAYADATDLDEAMAADARMENATSGAVKALRALITPPSVGESEIEVAHRIVDANLPDRLMHWDDKEVLTVAIQAFRAGIQSAHETWEAETAMRPSQEQMLRWLGIKFNQAPDMRGDIFIQAQMIEREEV